MQGQLDHRANLFGTDFIGLWNRIGDQLAAAQAQGLAHAQAGCNLLGSVAAQGGWNIACLRPKGGHDILTVGNHRNPIGFEDFHGFWDIEDRFWSGGHNNNRSGCQFA